MLVEARGRRPRTRTRTTRGGVRRRRARTGPTSSASGCCRWPPARSSSAPLASWRSGRPPCPLCGQPLDPQGHLCPRRNGTMLRRTDAGGPTRAIPRGARGTMTRTTASYAGAASVDALGLPMPAPDDVALELLRDGELAIVGRLLASTNNALLGLATRRCPDPEPDLVAACIYKPTIGERPLDDFPDGTLRPPRGGGVPGLGGQRLGRSCRRPSCATGRSARAWSSCGSTSTTTVDPVGLVIDEDERLRRIAAFDAAVNNTDRKAGHLLPVTGGAHPRRGPRGHVLARCRSCARSSGLARASRSRRTMSCDALRGAPRVPRRRAG